MTIAPAETKGSSSPQPSAGALCLNLGGLGEGFRDGSVPGFKTVDLRPGADYQCDASDLSIFKDSTVSEIYASNILEHFSLNRTVDVLKEWRRVLVKGGKLWLSVPDFDACVRLYLKRGLVPWVQYLIWGDQKHELNYHYINFTWASLSHLLYQAGYSDFKRLDNLPYGVQDASVLIDTVEGKPISLNVEATR